MTATTTTTSTRIDSIAIGATIEFAADKGNWKFNGNTMERLTGTEVVTGVTAARCASASGLRSGVRKVTLTFASGRTLTAVAQTKVPVAS